METFFFKNEDNLLLVVFFFEQKKKQDICKYSRGRVGGFNDHSRMNEKIMKKIIKKNYLSSFFFSSLPR